MAEEKAASVNIQRAVSVEFIRNSGGFAVRVMKGDKAADKGWDPRNNTKQKSDLLLESLAASEHNIGLHFFGPLVDVDIDNDSPFFMRAMETFLPSCAHVWGRKSKPRSHRAYLIKGADGFDPSEHRVLTRIKKITEAACEIRGGPQTRGTYSVLPGSIHPSGEEYTWSDMGRARSSLSVTTAETLVRAVRLSGAIAVLAPHWTSGIRNEMGMALAGFLHRSWSIGSSMSDEAFVLDYESAIHFYEVLMDLAGDEAADRHSRILSFEQTWNKAERGVPVTGASRMAELTGDESLVEKLYTLLCDSPDVSTIEEFTSRFVIWQGPGLVIDLDAVGRGEQRPFMTRKQFTDSYGHRFIQFVDKKKLAADVLFSLKSTGRVAGITFVPGEPRLTDHFKRGKLVNEWAGFDIKPAEEPVEPDEIEPFIRYIFEVVADGQEDRFKWVLGWLANIFRDPANKLGTALVLVGVPGVGKSFLGHQFIRPIIGDRHSAATNDVASITRDFNAGFDNKIFIQGDEATNNQQKATAARLRSLITDKTKMVEPKGVDPYEKPNHSRFLFTANDEENAIFLQGGLDDRRFTVLPVNKRYKGQIKQYWQPLAAWSDDKENLAKIHRYLKDYEYDRHFVGTPLVTEAKIIMVQHSWDTFDGWLAAMAARGHPLDERNHQTWSDAPSNDIKKKTIDRTEWPLYINLEALKDDYLAYGRFANRRGFELLNEHQMAHALGKRGLRPTGSPRTIRLPPTWDDKKGEKVEKRVRLYPMPSLKDVRNYIFEKYGMSIEEMITEDEPAPKAQDDEEI